MAKKFYLYQRKRAGKPPIWYVRFRSADGQVGKPVNTNLTDKQKAQEWALEQLLTAGEQGRAESITVPTFGEWATDWWLPGRCPYHPEKRADGYRISPKYAALRRGFLVNYLVPAVGSERVDRIRPQTFRARIPSNQRSISAGRTCSGCSPSVKA